MKKTKLLLIAAGFLLVFGCKDDNDGDDNDPSKYLKCCSDNVQSDYIWPVTAYTPDGDGLNDVFRVAEKQKDSSKAMEQIKTAHSFKAFNSDNQLIKSIDTLVSKASRKNMTWDFGDGSKIVLGAIRVEYVVEDYKGNKEQLVYHVCSYNCSVEKPDIDFSKCRYEDQIDPARGFVVATNQVPCN